MSYEQSAQLHAPTFSAVGWGVIAETLKRTQEELNAWCREANEQYEKNIRAILARIGSHHPKNLERFVYDWEGNVIGSKTTSDAVILETPELEPIMDEVQVTVTEGAAQVPHPGNTGRRRNQGEVTESSGDNEYSVASLDCGPEPIEDDFFTDDEAKIEESSNDTTGDGPAQSSNALDTLRLFFENNAMQDLESEDECSEEGLTEMFEMDDSSGPLDESKDEVTEEEQVPS
ncbi:hypothetical protein L1987_24896 [Smallanthus sonchifolius]|uniref:Uncharacterized protein n=1 Tax=Smallanthus sonchifolius TaxID=185202 RepID=A0ACB9IMM5_9ASTR|nr:hypothetical protein L1987_24896 [Smallanthus sonchifolius]